MLYVTSLTEMQRYLKFYTQIKLKKNDFSFNIYYRAPIVLISIFWTMGINEYRSTVKLIIFCTKSANKDMTSPQGIFVWMDKTSV